MCNANDAFRLVDTLMFGQNSKQWSQFQPPVVQRNTTPAYNTHLSDTTSEPHLFVVSPPNIPTIDSMVAIIVPAFLLHQPLVNALFLCSRLISVLITSDNKLLHTAAIRLLRTGFCLAPQILNGMQTFQPQQSRSPAAAQCVCVCVTHSKSACRLSCSTGVKTVCRFIRPSRVAESADAVYTSPDITHTHTHTTGVS